MHGWYTSSVHGPNMGYTPWHAIPVLKGSISVVQFKLKPTFVYCCYVLYRFSVVYSKNYIKFTNCINSRY